MMAKGVYTQGGIKTNKGIYKAKLPENFIPFPGDIVLGIIDDNDFHVLKRVASPTIPYVNPANQFGLDNNDQEIGDLIDGDSFMASNKMILGALQDFIIAKASELANITLFKDINLARIVGANMQTFSTAFALDAWGTDMLIKMFNESLTTENIKIFGAKEGDNLHIFTQEVSEGDGFLRGLSDVYFGADGRISIRTTKSVFIGKKSKLPNPFQKKQPDLKKQKSKSTNTWDADNPDGSNLLDDANNAIEETNSEVNLENSGWQFYIGEPSEDDFESFISIRDDGSLILRGPSGSFIELAKSGDIRISSSKQVLVDSAENTSVLAKNVDVRSRKSIGISSDEGNVAIYANDKIEMRSNELSIEADSNISIKSSNDILVFAAADLKLESSATATLKSGAVSILSVAPIDLRNLLINSTNSLIMPPGVITSISTNPTDLVTTPPSPDPFEFQFDREDRLKNNTIYQANWMVFINQPASTWSLADVAIKAKGNNTLPFPGKDASIKAHDGTEFINGPWKTK
jgi:hypothetical protein